MSERLANLLNLELAWQRLKFDRPDRIFVTNPYLIELVELDLGGFLRGISRADKSWLYTVPERDLSNLLHGISVTENSG